MSAAAFKKLKFAQHLCAGLHQNEAAARAGYTRGPGLGAQASKLLRDPVVVAELARLNGQIEARVTQRAVVAEAGAVLKLGQSLRRMTEQYELRVSQFFRQVEEEQPCAHCVGAPDEVKQKCTPCGGTGVRKIKHYRFDLDAAIHSGALDLADGI